MFYAHFVLSKKGPLARIWLAAHWDKKLTRAHVFETNISSSVEAILEPKLKMALRTSGHLLLGVVRIYSRKAKYLLADCNEAFVKIKMAFRPGVVDLPDEANREAAIAAITLPENIHDFEATIADLNEINMNTIAINQSRPEDITMREDFGEINLGRQDDDFGDSALDEVSSREIMREGDKTFDDAIYRTSDHLSVHHGGDLTLNSGPDMDATLINDKRGSRLHDSEKQIKSIDSTSKADDIVMDDHDFDDGFLGGPDDDDENFGGGLVHSLFTDGIFEDPLAQKQLEHLTSEIESHLVTSRFTTPVPTSGTGEIPAHDQIPVSKSADMFPPTSPDNVADSSAMTLQPGPLPVSETVLGMTTLNTESTTLIANESEAFALPPIDTTSATGVEPRRATKRKRRLIVDEQKSIPSEVMKSQMENTSDITTQLDLAPPTKKLMHWKETGSVDKLFTLPGRAIPSRVLQHLFVRNLCIRTVSDDAPEEIIQTSVLPNISAMQATQLHHDQTNTSVSSDAPHSRANSLDQNLSQPFSPALSHEAKDNLQVTGKLGAISELPEEEAAHFPSENQATESPATSHVHDDDNDDDHGHLDDDDEIHDDLAFGVEPDTPYLAPPSILSEAPASVMPADMLALERELAAADNEVEDELAYKAMNAIDNMPGTYGESYMSGLDVTAESIEERRLEKRSKVLLRMLRAHQQQHSWDQSLTLQSLCSGNTKKQAASKFYTVLLLRKQGAVDLSQEAPYANIYISKGPNFSRLVEA